MESITATTDISTLSASPEVCRKAFNASFGIYHKNVSHVESLVDDDQEHHGGKLKNLNKELFPQKNHGGNRVAGKKKASKSAEDIFEGMRYRVHVGLGEDNESISITYMGTDNTIDVLTDLRCQLEVWDPVNNTNIKVHSGFKASYKESREYVVKFIQELSRGKTITHIQVFGHSKGGAEATLAAYDLSHLGDFKVSLLTFGQPHVGNKAFVEDFKTRLENRIGIFVRFVNLLDPVPKLLDGLNLALPEGDRYEHHCKALTLDGWLLDRDYIDSFIKKAESNISALIDSIKSIPADLSDAAIKKVSMAFDPKKHFHGSWHYIYHLELILQGKRITVDQAGNIVIKNLVDIAVNKGGELLFNWGAQALTTAAQSSSVSALVPAVQQATASGGSIISAGSGAAAAVSILPAITCVLSFVNAAGTVYNMYQLREVTKQNEQILDGVARIEKNIAKGVAEVNMRLDAVQSSIILEARQVNGRLDNLQQSVEENISTKIDGAVMCLEKFIQENEFKSTVNKWSAQFKTINRCRPDDPSYLKFFERAEEIKGRISTLSDEGKFSAMMIYLQKIIKIGSSNAKLLTDKNAISDDILGILGEFVLSIIMKQSDSEQSISRESLMDLSTMANQMQHLLHGTTVVQRDTTEESICWNVALHLSGNGGVDLLINLFQLLHRTSSLENVETLEFNIKQIGNLLNPAEDDSKQPATKRQRTSWQGKGQSTEERVPEKNNALPLCLSKLSQLESEPERAVMSFYRIFKGRHDGGLSFRTIIQDLKALVGGKSTIFRLYELLAHYNESIHSDISCDACEMSPIVGIRDTSTVYSDYDLCQNCEAASKSKRGHPFIQIADTDRIKLLKDILQSLGSEEEDPSNRFDAMYCLRFKAGDDEWSAKELKEHVTSSYDYLVSYTGMDEGESRITREQFDMLKMLSDPDMFNHGDSSTLLACLISENRLPEFEGDETVLQLGDKVLLSDSDASARRAIAIALVQKAAEQQFDRVVKKELFVLRAQKDLNVEEKKALRCSGIDYLKQPIEAQYQLGLIYFHGSRYYDVQSVSPLEQDNMKAVHWWKKAAGGGHAVAQCYLGVCYGSGQCNGVKKDMKEAIKWYDKAANSFQTCKDNVPSHIKDAKEWHEKNNDNLAADIVLAFIYNHVEGNAEKAKERYENAANQRLAEAQYKLGLCYDYSRGVVGDRTMAVKWYIMAADQGHADAQYFLGQLYWKSSLNIGTHRDPGVVPKEYRTEAVRWSILAANQGHAAAQCFLGECFDNGYDNGYGVLRDNTEAVRWYTMAADQDYAKAQFILGQCYSFGRGTTKDEKEAARWFILAANQGHVDAQFNLGHCYRNGRGVSKDEEEAVRWFSKAAAQKQNMAQDRLKQILKK